MSVKVAPWSGPAVVPVRRLHAENNRVRDLAVVVSHADETKHPVVQEV